MFKETFFGRTSVLSIEVKYDHLLVSNHDLHANIKLLEQFVMSFVSGIYGLFYY